MIASPSVEPGVARRLDELRATFRLDDRATTVLASLLAALEADTHAPSTVRDASAAVDVHVADSLSALELAAVADARRIADVGAGAGFPGLALAAALPAARVWLVESSRRKASFIEAMARAARLDNAHAVAARVEDWHAGIGAHDLVTARALAPLAVICEYGAPLLAPGGALVAWKGSRDRDEESRAAVAAAELGLAPGEVVAVTPFAGARDRHLHVYLKVRETPERFPRRTGIARKRPLGG